MPECGGYEGTGYPSGKFRMSGPLQLWAGVTPPKQRRQESLALETEGGCEHAQVSHSRNVSGAGGNDVETDDTCPILRLGQSVAERIELGEDLTGQYGFVGFLDGILQRLPGSGTLTDTDGNG